MGRQEEAPCPPWGSRGRPGALLAAAILSSCFLLIQAQDKAIPIQVEPSRPLVEQNVTLTPGGDPSYLQCTWYRGALAEANKIFLYVPAYPLLSPGPHFTGRESIGPNCSLHISYLTLNDSGIYSVSKTVRDGPETGSVIIQVLEKLTSPTVWPPEAFVKEHANVTLNCSTSASDRASVFWFKNGESLPAKAILSERNRTLTVPDIGRDDAGSYTCMAWNPANNATSNPSKIVVESAPGPPGDPGLSAGAIVGIVIGCLVGVVLIVAVLYFALKSTTFGRMEQHSSNGNIPSAPGRNQGVTDTKPAAGEEDIQYTTLAFNSSSPPQSSLGPNIPLESSTIYSVIKKK